MTWDEWKVLSRAEQDKLRDNSALHPMLIGKEGKRVRVTPKRAHGRSTFRVGRTTGWRPVHLAMRAGAYGSSDVISACESFDSVVEVR